jgi:hypothetical protein
MVLRHHAHVPTWAAYLLPVRQFLFLTLATGTSYHDDHRNKPTTSGMSIAHTFDCTANWLLYLRQQHRLAPRLVRLVGDILLRMQRVSVTTER